MSRKRDREILKCKIFSPHKHCMCPSVANAKANEGGSVTSYKELGALSSGRMIGSTESMPIQVEWLPERIQSGETIKEVLLRPNHPEDRTSDTVAHTK